MESDVSALFGIMKWVMIAVGVLPFVIVFFVFRRVFKFKDNVLGRISMVARDRITQAPGANRSYVKTKCDHCGGKCTGSTDISPSGDIKCSYCDSWFNILR